MAKLTINKEEMVLLKNSEAAKNSEIYGNLFHVIQPYITLTEEEFQSNILFDDKSRAVIMNNKKILFTEIKNEWHGIGFNDEATVEMHCQLCGRKNKYIFYIQNKLNGIELNVGSDCINKFPGIQDIATYKRSFNEQLKLQTENKRKIEFDEIDLDSMNYIKHSEQWFTNFKIILPYKLYENIKSTLYSLNSLKTIYIKQGGKIETVKAQYFELKNILESYKNEAEEIYITRKANPLICKKDLSDWLNVHHPDIWEKVLQNDGFLDENTLKYCYYPKFIEKNLHKFGTKISDKAVRIIGMNGNLIRFSLKNNDYIHALYFNIKSDIFMFNIGCYCLSNTNYSFNTISLAMTNAVRIEQSSSNFKSLLNRLLSPLNTIGLGIEKSEVTDEIYYVRLPKVIATSPSGQHSKTSELAYKKISSQNFYNIMNTSIFKSDEEIIMQFKTILVRLNNNTQPWMSKEEKDRYENLSKALAMQKQREFIPYT